VSIESPDPTAASGSAQPATAERLRQSRELLDSAWEIVSDLMLARAGDIFNEAISAAARTSEESQVRCARALSLQGKNLVLRYRAALKAGYDDAVAGFLTGREAPALRPLGLSLVEMDHSDLASQVSQGATRLRGLVQTPWSELNMRLQTLAGGRELADQDSPLRPALFLQAIADTLAAAVPASAELAALLRHFPAILQGPLAATYEGVSRFLDSRGIAPTVAVRNNPVVRASAPAPARSEAPAALAGMALGGDADAAAPAPARAAAKPAPGRAGAARAPVSLPAEPGGEPDEAGLAEYARLQALFGVNAMILLEAAGVAARAGADADADGRPSLPAPLTAALLAGQKRDAEYVAARDRDSATVPPGTRELSRTLISLASQPVHKLSVQLVARIFARIERDLLLPAPIRDLLVYLRFPVLEYVLADPGLLVRVDNPARRLINGVAGAAIGWTPEAPNARRFLQNARAVVQFVLNSPGSAPSAFGQAYTQFTNYLAGDAPIAEPIYARAWEALTQAEQAEQRTADVSAFLREILEGAVLDERLRGFVLQVWARVLVEAHARDGVDGALMRRLLNAVPDLVWSAQPLASAGERKRLIETIPLVLNALREGLHLIHWPEAQRKDLLEHLIQTHAQVLAAADSLPENAPLRQGGFSVSTVRIRLDGFRMETLAPAPAESPVQVLEESVRHVLRARTSGVSHQWPSEAPQALPTAPDPERALAQVARWRDKTWFDLRVGSGMVRVRLEGYTPGRLLALFSSLRGDALYSLSRAGLVAYLRASWITPAESSPLLARSFGTVLLDLERTARAGDSGGGAP